MIPFDLLRDKGVLQIEVFGAAEQARALAWLEGGRR